MPQALEYRTRADFRLVQRLQRRPVERSPQPEAAARPSRPLEHGCIGDYQLDYMGAAEFGGAVLRAYHRFTVAAARGDLVQDIHWFEGTALDVLGIGSEGDPRPEWDSWMSEKAISLDRQLPDLLWEHDLREPTEFFMQVGSIERVEGIEDRAQIWWALEANVMWALRDGEDGHLQRMLRSMGETPFALVG